MPDLIREIGAVAGLAAFLGLAVLALLYFAQARDVRRLRENAEFLLERPEEAVAPAAAEASEPAEPATAAAPAAAATTAGAGTPGAATPAASKGAASKSPAAKAADAETFRRAELARQAADRRQRFERRRTGQRGLTAAGAGGGRFDSLPETRSLVVIVIGVALLVAGIAFGATRLLGDNGGAGKKKEAAAQVEVAVLNSTAQPGLAGEFGQQVKKAGFNLGKVGNSSSPEDVSLVEYDRDGREAAQQVAQLLDIRKIEPMSGEIRSLAEGAPVAVVLGADKASGG